MKKIINWFKTEFFTGETLSYLIIGLISTAMNWTLTYVFNNTFKLGYWISSSLTFVICTAFSYIMNGKYTFKSTESRKETLPKYILEVAICFGLAYGLGKIVLDWFFSNIITLPLSKEKMDTLKGILAGVCHIGLNYLGQKFFVFRKKSAEPEEGTGSAE